MRDLQRFECELTQYANEGETVMPVSEILVRTGAEMSRAFKIFENQADVSGMIVRYLGDRHTYMYILVKFI